MHKLTPLKAAIALFMGGAMLCPQVAARSVRDYRSCVSLVARNAVQAFEAAQEWRDYGGGSASRHCLALALVARGMYGRAAELLEEVASAQQPLAEKGKAAWTLDAELRTDLLVQAGNAWLIAGKAGKAYATFNAALAEPSLSNAVRGELLIDRSRALAGTSDYRTAVADLDRASELLGERADILTYRANVRRAAGALGDAKDNIERALQLAPDSPDALLERGTLRRAVDDFAGAKADWIRVGQVAPGSSAAAVAAANLAALDAHIAAGHGEVIEEAAPIRLELRGLPPVGDVSFVPLPSARAQDGKAPTQP